ncbi:MAG: ribonuclease HII [Oligoflexia bacterium]|nr:ribonuclease HII [Oligoflexia bacterium]
MKKASSLKEDLKPIDWVTFGVELTAGVDEAGRGCLAGPVYAAAVIVRPDYSLKGLTDSKLMTPEKRFELAVRIKEEAVCWAIGIGTVEEIEEINILHASLLAMKRAVENLSLKPELLLIDGNQTIKGHWVQKTLIKGDLRCLPISAASVLAKTQRDIHMMELDEKFPGYKFATHKGYGTLQHRQAIEKLGPSIVHRRLFSGVREFLDFK